VSPWTTFFLAVCIGSSALGGATIPAGRLSPGQSYFSELVYAEQFLNDRVENTREFESIRDVNSLPYLYRPESQVAFTIPVFLVPAESVVVLSTKKISDEYYKDPRTGMIRFFVHPQSTKAFAAFTRVGLSEVGWRATPTSSYRAVWAWNTQNQETTKIYGLKLSLDAEIGNISRMLSRAQIERATIASMALQLTPPQSLARQGIFFIDEPVSVYFKEFQFGYTIREYPKLPVGSSLVPLFSLYSKKMGTSHLQNLIDASGLSAKEFVSQNLIEPLVRQTFFLAFTEGFIGAPHEQNVLAEVRNGQLTGRFYYRDLGSYHINTGLRALAGKSTDFIPKTFLPENLRSDKNNLIASIQDYLLWSQFYAMKRSLRPGQLSDEWVEKTMLKVIEVEIYKHTGHRPRTWMGAKTSTAQHLMSRMCRRSLY
jgi:hypothetical protein